MACPPVLANETAALTFGSMEPGGKMALLAVALRFRNGHFRKALLVRLAPVDADAVHRRQDDEGVGLHELCRAWRKQKSLSMTAGVP